MWSGVKNVKKETSAAAPPAAAATPVTKIAFFDGAGTSQSADPGFLSVLLEAAALTFDPDGFAVTKLKTGAEVAAVSPAPGKDYHVLVFPGGSGNGQAKELGGAGLAAVRAFVAAGGGYIGTCGGAFLGIQHLFFYGQGPNGPDGHRGPPTQEPFARGHGDVLVQFTDTGTGELKLNPAVFGSGGNNMNVTIMYWQGPIVKDEDLPGNVSRLATFRSEIHSGHTNETTGEMVNTPAITSIGYGEGRVVLNSPHPEIPTEAGPLDPAGNHTFPSVYAGELAWVLRRGE
jgi:glutamine amidotransferase-like uncharacterized protein